MTEKQDRQGARTAAQLEQKYRFGESFAEAVGLATQAVNTANEANKNASNPAANLTPQEVFDLLTDNGKYQGIFKDDDGNIHISATYVSPGILSSANGKVRIDLTGETAGMPVFNSGISTNGLVVRGDFANAKQVLTVSVEGSEALNVPVVTFWDRGDEPLMILTEDEDRTGGIMKITAINENGVGEVSVQAIRNNVGIALSLHGVPVGFFVLNEKEQSVVDVDRVDCSIFDGKMIRWQQQPDGSYLLMGWDVEN
jgi:hypothetical protein